MLSILIGHRICFFLDSQVFRFHLLRLCDVLRLQSNSYFFLSMARIRTLSLVRYVIGVVSSQGGMCKLVSLFEAVFNSLEKHPIVLFSLTP